MMASITRRKAARILLPLAFWLGVWQLLSARIGQELLLPSPAAVARTLGGLLTQGNFWLTTGATLGRIFAGTLAGILLGIVLAVLSCLSPLCDCILSPAVRVVRATPVASFIVLILLWVRTGRVPAVISALMVLPVVWGNVVRGVHEIDAGLLEMARVYRFGRLKTLRLVAIPSVMPYFASACLTALGLSWKAGVAAEVLCRPQHAVGSQVYFSKINLESPSLFAWTLVVIALSFALEKGLSALLRRAQGRFARKGEM